MTSCLHMHSFLFLSVYTWNSWSSFLSIQSVTWTKVTSLSPSLGRAFSSRWGGLRKPYLTAKRRHWRWELQTYMKTDIFRLFHKTEYIFLFHNMRHFVEEMHCTNKDHDDAADRWFPILFGWVHFWPLIINNGLSVYMNFEHFRRVIFPSRTFSFEGHLEPIIHNNYTLYIINVQIYIHIQVCEIEIYFSFFFNHLVTPLICVGTDLQVGITAADEGVQINKGD